MLTKLQIKNFKRLKDTHELEIDDVVVFIGPNNSGKTSALQALALWDVGLKKWIEKKSGKTSALQRTAVSINRKDIFAVPTPGTKYLWNDLQVRTSAKNKQGKKIVTKNVAIEVIVGGINEGKVWNCGLEFGYQGEEVLYCRPIQSLENNAILTNPKLLKAINVAYLPPMSGLVSDEPKLLLSTISVRIGEGRTAEVLRNLCYQIVNPELPGDYNDQSEESGWNYIVSKIQSLFGIKLNKPLLNERGEIIITYQDEHEKMLDLSSSGRGLQQVLLLMAYLHVNPNAVLLIDEPDAHLEILRQRQIYSLITDLAKEKGSQIIAASHSEVVLNEAAEKDIVIAFIGDNPHRINNRGSQVLKSLTTIGFDQYYQAELKKWVLYLEGSTDLKILQQFAKILEHPAAQYLNNPFVHYVSTNLPQKAREHFYGLQEAVPVLKGIAIFDRIENPLEKKDLKETMWSRCEIENYIFIPEVLIRYITRDVPFDLFGAAEREKRIGFMKNAIENIVPKIAQENENDKYWKDIKASEEIERIFDLYFKDLKMPNMMRKNKLYLLVDVLSKEKIDQEVKDKLELICNVVKSVDN